METTDLNTEFFSSFGDSGNQAEAITENEPVEQEETSTEEAEGMQEATEGQQAEEAAEEATEEQGEEKPTEQPQTIHIKVNKEERDISLEEATELAQKGADYDRVKKQSEESRSKVESLTAELAEKQEAYAVIEAAAKDAGVTVPEFLDKLAITRLAEKENISFEVAAERHALNKANARIAELTKQPPKTDEQKAQERFDREIKEFREKYPDVDISELPADRVAQDIADGKTMTQSYQDIVIEKERAENKRLADELAAFKQNARNRATAPGSTSDSGSKKNKEKTSDFWSQFN